jgi:DNA polymerase (family 10)
MEKKEVIRLLQEIADLLELRGENPFKAQSYRAAARTLEGYSGDFDALVYEGRLGGLKGFGEGITKKVTEYVSTGRMSYYEEIRKGVPAGLLTMLEIPQLGPKKVKAIHEHLGISTIEDLEAACQEDRISQLPGFGAKSQVNILEGIRFRTEHAGRFLLSVAREAADGIFPSVEKHSAVKRASVAGSLRRSKETVKDIDLVAASAKLDQVMEAFCSHESVEHVHAKGKTKSSVLLKAGINCDLRVVADVEYPYALAHFTGSREHNTAMRARAKERGLKLNEYGLFRGKRRLACQDEAAIFRKLDLEYVPPELREDCGEIEAAEAGEIPELVEAADIRGTFHCHTNYSDGHLTLEQLAREAAELGFEYVGVADHSRSAAYAGGLKEEAVVRQLEEIDGLNDQGNLGCHLLKGIESDILADGRLDYPEKILSRFDFVIASVHSRFNLPEKQMTQRVIRALRNPYPMILGHPTGRLLLSRDAYAIDLEAVIEAAAEAGAMIEINSNPHRLDLDWRWCKRAKEAGVMLVIAPDAHDAAGLADTYYGVGIARKGWLTAADVLNTRPVDEVRKLLASRSKG